MHFLKTLKSLGGEPPLPRRGIARHFQNKLVDAVEEIPNELRLADALPQDT